MATSAQGNLMQLSGGTAHRMQQLLTEYRRTSAALAGDPAAVQFLVEQVDIDILVDMVDHRLPDSGPLQFGTFNSWWLAP